MIKNLQDFSVTLFKDKIISVILLIILIIYITMIAPKLNKKTLNILNNIYFKALILIIIGYFIFLPELFSDVIWISYFNKFKSWIIVKIVMHSIGPGRWCQNW